MSNYSSSMGEAMEKAGFTIREEAEEPIIHINHVDENGERPFMVINPDLEDAEEEDENVDFVEGLDDEQKKAEAESPSEEAGSEKQEEKISWKEKVRKRKEERKAAKEAKQSKKEEDVQEKKLDPIQKLIVEMQYHKISRQIDKKIKRKIKEASSNKKDEKVA